MIRFKFVKGVVKWVFVVDRIINYRNFLEGNLVMCIRSFRMLICLKGNYKILEIFFKNRVIYDSVELGIM